MRPALFLMLFTFPLFTCCTHSKSKDAIKNQIRQVESDFQKMTEEKGIAEAFYHFAAPDAVIKRENDTLIVGKVNIKTYYEKKHLLTNASVEWAPDYIEVSASADLAYTYGKYVWTIKKDTTVTQHKGVFHTVWKKQPDGSWMYVWD